MEVRCCAYPVAAMKRSLQVSGSREVSVLVRPTNKETRLRVPRQWRTDTSPAFILAGKVLFTEK